MISPTVNSDDFVNDLKNPARPTFLFGVTPPRDGTSDEKALEAVAKFTSRSSVLATDGFIIYDIQEEKDRVDIERPFPFRKTLDPSWYASLFPKQCGKQCIVYKCVVEESAEKFDNWIDTAIVNHQHKAFNLVGAPTSKVDYAGLTLKDASLIVKGKPKATNVAFGCVCIAERHARKNEALIMTTKSEWGAEWFISQGIYSSEAIVKLLIDYGDMCRARGVVAKKVILTFAPCGRAKTMSFIKWLGMNVPIEVEQRILNAEKPVDESITLLSELLVTILEQTHGSGVPLGINVESLSIFKEEIDGAHTLFQRLQTLLLNQRGSPWAVRWFLVNELRPVATTNTITAANGNGVGNGDGNMTNASKSSDTLPVVVSGKKHSSSVSKRSDGRSLEQKLLIAVSVLGIVSSTLLITVLCKGRRVK